MAGQRDGRRIRRWQVVAGLTIGIMASLGCGALLLGAVGVGVVASTISTIKWSEASRSPRALWVSPLPDWPDVAVPAYDGTRVWVVMQRQLLSRAADGSSITYWRLPIDRTGLEGASALVRAGSALVVAGREAVAAVEARTGEVRWSHPVAPGLGGAGRAFADSTTTWVVDGTGTVHAWALDSGVERWAAAFGAGACDAGCRAGGIVVAGDTVYAAVLPVATADAASRMVLVGGFDRASGRALFVARVDGQPGPLLVPFAVSGPVLLLGGASGEGVGAFDRFALSWRWRRPVELSASVRYPALYEGTLLFASQGAQLVRLDAVSGDPRGRGNAGEPLAAAAACPSAHAVLGGPGIRWLSLERGHSDGAQPLGRNELVVHLLTAEGRALLVGARGTLAGFACGAPLR
jgi:outer membrane protein assembly factor BamB